MVRFPVVKVSEEVDRLIGATVAAAKALGEADATDREAVEVAYSHLSMARRALYEHVEILEENSRFNITRDVSRRF